MQQYILNRLDADASLRKHLSRENAEMLNLLHIKSNGTQFRNSQKYSRGYLLESFKVLLNAYVPTETSLNLESPEKITISGCLLYLEHVLDGVVDNSIVLREIRDIPGTLNGLYLWYCQRLFGSKIEFDTEVRPLLCLLLTATRPVPFEVRKSRHSER